MEIRIGVVYSPKELIVELPEGKEGDKAVTAAVASIEEAIDKGGHLAWLTDTKGRRVGVPTDKIAYVEIDTDDERKRVGFAR